MILVCLLILLNRAIHADPTIAFPVNSQVPPVARVSQPFAFQFAQTTFTTASLNEAELQYTLDTDAPTWLRLDGATRTFSGTPGTSDLGAASFSLTATDNTGSASMQVTFVVVDLSTPQPTGNITDQLTKFGTLSGPTTLAMYPSTAFVVTFAPTSFSSLSDPCYYATTADRSPLPSWIEFDASSLTFSGLTLPSVPFAEVIELILFVSRVPGFAEAWFSFGFEVSNHRLVFREVEDIISIPAFGAVDFKLPYGELLLDGQPISQDELFNVSATLPNWLHLNSEENFIQGRAPTGTTAEQITISAADIYGDEAVLVLQLKFESSLFAKQIPTLNATAGQPFTYTVDDSILNDVNVTLNVELNDATSWLHFNVDSLMFYGTPPSTSNLTITNITITAHLPFSNVSETQAFVIRIRPSSPASAVQSRNAASSPTATTSSQPMPSQDRGSDHSNKVSTNERIGIGIACGFVGLSILAAFTWMFWNCRSNVRPWVSKPIVGTSSFRRLQHNCRRDGQGKMAVEKSPEVFDVERFSREEQPPQLQDGILGFEHHVGFSKHRHGISANTVLLPADEAMLRDMNRSSFGTDALGVHAPHDAMKLASQIAREGSPLSIALSRRESCRSIVSIHRHGSKHSQARLRRTSHGISKRKAHKNAEFPNQIFDGSHDASFRSSNVSVVPWVAKSRAEMAYRNTERAWIRCVTPGLEDLHAMDTRSLAERRQSYIRHRASTNQGNPLFAARDVLSKHASSGYRTPLSHRTSNTSHKLGVTATFTRSKSSSIGVRAGRSSRSYASNRPSVRSGDGWQTASSNYSSEDSENDLGGEVDEEGERRMPHTEKLVGSRTEREIKKSKWSQRLRRDGRGEFMDAITEGDATISVARPKVLMQNQYSTQSKEQTFVPRERLVSTGTNASSFYGTDAFL